MSVTERAGRSPAAESMDDDTVRTHRSVGDHIADYALVLAMLGLIAVFSILEPSAFLALDTFQVMLSSQAVLVMLALAAMIPLLTNSFDVSIGAVLSFAAVETWVFTHEFGIPLGIAAVLVILSGVFIGAVNSWLIVHLNIDSFIATLGMSTLITGIALFMSNQAIVTDMPDFLSDITATKVLGLQLIFYYAMALAVVLWFVLEYTQLGRWLIASGAAPDVGRLVGLPVSRLRVMALVASATICALAGLLQAGQLGAADPNSGHFLLLPTFAAIFLGQTAVKRGRFNVWGTVIAVYVVIIGIVGLQITTGASGWVVFVFNGGVLLIALVASSLSKRQPHVH